MKLDDLTVEVRLNNLERVGEIASEYLTDMKLIKRFNNVGSWELTLPADLAETALLMQQGAGILVTGPNDFVLMSGRTLNFVNSRDADDPIGTWKFTGVDDMVHLADATAWPQPGNPDPGTQNVANDVRSGPAEIVLRDLVRFNIGPNATSDRRINTIVMGPNFSAGDTVIARARFDPLGELMGTLAAQGGVGFDMAQVDQTIVFRVYEPQDRSDSIRMDIDNDMLDSTEYGLGSPTVTRVIVAGQGEGTERNIRKVTAPTSAAAEANWGRKIEVFKDRRDTDDNTELDLTGSELVVPGSVISKSLKVTPSDDQTMLIVVDWWLGDIVTVTVDDQELPAVVTEAIIATDENGVFVGATIGDPTGFDFESKLIANQAAQDKRIGELERRDNERVIYTGLPTASTDSQRDGIYPSPLGGEQVARTDTGSNQVYLAGAWRNQPQRIDAGKVAWTDTDWSSAGTQDLGSGVSAPSANIPTVIEVEAYGQFSSTGTTGVRRLARFDVVTTAGTVVTDSVQGIRATAGDTTPATVFIKATITLPASTAATFKVQGIVDGADGRMYAGTWRWRRLTT